MKKINIVILLAGMLLFANSSFGAAKRAETKQNTPTLSADIATASEFAKSEWDEMSRKEKRAKKKSIKKEIKNAIKSASDTESLLLVIVAILLPPLAMALYDGISNRFWISLLLTLLFYLPGLIYTLIIILGGK